MPSAERDIERACVAAAKKAGWVSVKVGDDGMPDRLFLRPDRPPLWVEFKRKGGKLSRLQAAVIDNLRKGGHSVIVVDSVDQFVIELNRTEWRKI